MLVALHPFNIYIDYILPERGGSFQRAISESRDSALLFFTTSDTGAEDHLLEKCA